MYLQLKDEMRFRSNETKRLRDYFVAEICQEKQ